MKKLNLHQKFFPIFLILFLVACSKSIDMTAPSPDKSSQSEIINDETFEAFNNSIVRFDPLYIQTMYNEKKSKSQIQEQSTSLLNALLKNPNNTLAQQAIISFYHFENYKDFQKASQQITNTAIQFQLKYLNPHYLFSNVQKEKIIKARKYYVNNKIQQLEEAIQKKSNGIWNDKVDEFLLEFHYWTLVQNEELEIENSGSSDCNDACCYDYKACLTRAASAYRVNFLTLGSAMAATGGSIGALYGSIIPIIGTASVGTGAGILGGVAGFIQAVNIYLKDQEACVYSYKACIIRQNQK